MDNKEYEKWLIDHIEYIKEQYIKAAEPYVQELVKLRELDTNISFYISEASSWPKDEK